MIPEKIIRRRLSRCSAERTTIGQGHERGPAKRRFSKSMPDDDRRRRTDPKSETNCWRQCSMLGPSLEKTCGQSQNPERRARSPRGTCEVSPDIAYAGFHIARGKHSKRHQSQFVVPRPPNPDRVHNHRKSIFHLL